jgi:hypothetical protein
VGESRGGKVSHGGGSGPRRVGGRGRATGRVGEVPAAEEDLHVDGLLLVVPRRHGGARRLRPGGSNSK